MSNKTNTTGTSSNRFSIGQMDLEYVNDGINDGLKITIPGYAPIYIRAKNPNTVTKWIHGSADPTLEQGNLGDFYLKTNGSIFEKQLSGWVLITTIVGSQGPQGVEGSAGPPGPPGQQGPSGSITSASDANIVNLEDNDVLIYSSNDVRWVNRPLADLIDGGFF